MDLPRKNPIDYLKQYPQSGNKNLNFSGYVPRCVIDPPSSNLDICPTCDQNEDQDRPLDQLNQTKECLRRAVHYDVNHAEQQKYNSNYDDPLIANAVDVAVAHVSRAHDRAAAHAEQCHKVSNAYIQATEQQVTRDLMDAQDIVSQYLDDVQKRRDHHIAAAFANQNNSAHPIHSAAQVDSRSAQQIYIDSIPQHQKEKICELFGSVNAFMATCPPVTPLWTNEHLNNACKQHQKLMDDIKAAPYRFTSENQKSAYWNSVPEHIRSKLQKETVFNEWKPLDSRFNGTLNMWNSP